MTGNIGQTLAPFFGVLGHMENAEDDHLSTGILVKDGVRESPHKCPTILIVDFRVEFWHATN